MKAKEFIDNDEAFKQWRERNLNGFILNLRRPSDKNKRHFVLRAVKLHAAQCPTMLPDINGEKPWTSTGYIKVCSNDAKDLVGWFNANADKPTSGELPRCKRCAP